MALTRVSTGPVYAKIQFNPNALDAADGGFPDGAATALLDLGYSEDGFQITERPMIQDVFSDRKGGPNGEPVDIQYLGKTTMIRGRLTEFEVAQMTRLQQFLTAGSMADGEVKGIGCLVITDGQFFRLLLQGDKDAAAIAAGGTATNFRSPMNFQQCFIREAIDFNIGSKVTSYELVIQAYSFLDAADSKTKTWNRDTVA